MKKTNYSEISKQKLEYLNYSINTINNYFCGTTSFVYSRIDKN